ncbi:FAD-linked sulfhydryl oxidase [Acrasis kona]|uniref:Sulfhydryl oxidase n=1 Tax=Acrasis kona TaxID=1008807 RepID=A0AAW2YSA2_9EUKA
MSQQDTNVKKLKDGLGPGAWAVLHTVAATFPDKPTTSQQRHVKQFIHRFAEFYPCQYCAEDFRESIKQNPVDTSNKEALSMWMCHRHNEVNVKLGKSSYNCDRIWEKWGASKPGGEGHISQKTEPGSNLDDLDDADDDDDFDTSFKKGDDCGFCEENMGSDRYQQLKNLLKK